MLPIPVLQPFLDLSLSCCSFSSQLFNPGRKEFELSCQSSPLYIDLFRLYENILQYEILSLEGEMQAVAESILREDLGPTTAAGTVPQLTAIYEKIQLYHNTTHQHKRNLFEEAKEEVEKILRGEPFDSFKQSLYYSRFLQWKVIPVHDSNTMHRCLPYSPSPLHFQLHPLTRTQTCALFLDLSFHPFI